MTSVFLDTAFWIALLGTRDQHHESALKWKDWIERTTVPLITTEPALWELLDGCSSVLLRQRGIVIYRSCYSDPRIEVVEATTQRMEQALDLYESVEDKDWGITDCFSFAVMRDRGIFDALTSDHHFEQAGFRALLREEPPIHTSRGVE